MLVRRVIDDQLSEYAQLAPPRFLHEAPEVGHRAEIGIDCAVVGNVIPIVPAGGGIERQQPQRRDAEILEIIEFFRQPCEIPDAITVAVGKRLNVELINDGVLEPQLVGFELGLRLNLGHHIHDTTFT